MKKYGLMISLFLLILKVGAQTNEAKLDSLLADVLFGEEDFSDFVVPQKSHHFLYARTNFDTKTFYAGRELGEDQLAATGQVMYFNSWGLHAAVSGYWYRDIDPQYSLTLASVGYSNKLWFCDKLRVRGSYDHYFYNLSGTDWEPEYFGSLSAGASFRHKWIGASVDASFLLGGDFRAAYSASVYSKFNLFKVGKSGKISIRPRLQLYFGSEEVEYIQLDTFEYYYQEESGLMNTQLAIPLLFTYKGFDISVSYRYNLPRSLDPAYEYDNSSFFSFSVGYFFGLNRK